MEIKMNRMKELVKLLNEASDAYYKESREIISNYEYDKLNDELVALETSLGIILPDSPTQKVENEIKSSKFEKVKHKYPALSLNKTKDPVEINSWAKRENLVISWKLDGLTLVATYLKGKLQRLVTRGNGEVGEDVTIHAKDITSLPATIDYDGELIVRGEGVISYSSFDAIKDAESERDFKNPRNLASGTIRTLEVGICRKRKVEFIAFQVVSSVDGLTTKMETFKFLTNNGFNVVDHQLLSSSDDLSMLTKQWGIKSIECDYPVDGLVFTINNLEEGSSRGLTNKFSLDSMAFKWQDETKKTIVKEIFWSASKTGLLNPVAIFEPVELEGTTVQRASIHNITIMKNLGIGVGAEVEVYKANMIIPQVSKVTQSGDNLVIPDICPVCGGKTKVVVSKDKDTITETLCCTNEKCTAKMMKHYSFFVSRDAMNIDGLSEKKLETLIGLGIIHNLADIYKISNHKNAIVSADGFGERSYQNLIDAIENSKNVDLQHFIYALSIPLIGHDLSKKIALKCKYNFDTFMNLFVKGDPYLIDDIEGYGPVAAENISKWSNNQINQPSNNWDAFSELVSMLNFKQVTVEIGEKHKGKTFVITGSLNHFKNRDELVALIESEGGKVSGSVSKNTDYLINNDTESTSGKNKKAKELGVLIISEENFINL